MRSSGSTPRRPEGGIRLALVVVGDDHPRACTGRRLIRRRLVRELRRLPTGDSGPVVLDPYAERPLSLGDRPRALRAGLVAVDCSWNRLSERWEERAGRGPRAHGAGARRLPMLLAGNPQHFGRLAELNTVEALAAGLVLLGEPAAGEALLDGFAGGTEFLRMNADRLARYLRAGSAEQVVQEERALFGPGPS